MMGLWEIVYSGRGFYLYSKNIPRSLVDDMVTFGRNFAEPSSSEQIFTFYFLSLYLAIHFILGVKKEIFAK
jgi:hypothetical protein